MSEQYTWPQLQMHLKNHPDYKRCEVMVEHGTFTPSSIYIGTYEIHDCIENITIHSPGGNYQKNAYKKMVYVKRVG